MKPQTIERLKDALSITLIMLITYICINLLFELATVELYRGLGFSKGYITISGKPIGHHILSYLVASLLGCGIIFYSSKEILIK